MWVSLIASGFFYLRWFGRVRRAKPGRRRSFVAGLLVLAIALASPIAALDGNYFWVHMLQHMLITLVAAPLLVLGAPVTLALRATTGTARARIVAVTKHPVTRAIGHPLVAWIAFISVLWLSHFTALYGWALESYWAHMLEHALYLGTALLFWRPVVGTDPGAATLGHATRLAFVALAMPAHMFLGLVIYSSDDVLYDHYAVPGHDVLADQELAGILMWIGANPPLLIALVAVMLAWVSKERTAS